MAARYQGNSNVLSLHRLDDGRSGVSFPHEFQATAKNMAEFGFGQVFAPIRDSAELLLGALSEAQ